MSRDIRSFFQPKKVQQAKVEDDDVIPESPDVHVKNKKKDTRKRRVINDESDEEKTIPKPKKDDKNKKGDSNSKQKKLATPALKEVKSVDLFGSGPIKRTEPLVKKKKKTETGIHSDEEFEKSLLEIDSAEFESQINGAQIDIPVKSVPKEQEAGPSKTVKKSSTEKSPTKCKQNLSAEKDNEILTNDVSKEKKHSNYSNLNKESKDYKAKDGKNHHQTVASDSNRDTKSKIDNSKRKFAEFIDNDISPDDSRGKKKKLNGNHDGENKDRSKKRDYNKHDGSALEVMVVDDSSSETVKLNDNHHIENKDKSLPKNYKEHNTSTVEDDNKHAKTKSNKSLNESVLTDEERHERRIASAALYKSYLNRSGPKHLGAKEIPEGTPDCLKDCAFVLTGVLDSFEKDEVAAAINKYGGSVKSGVTKKVTHVIAGEDAGPAKTAKARELGIKIINEDEFLKMIKDRSKKKTPPKLESKKEIKKEKTPHKSSSKDNVKNESSSKDKKHHHVDKESKRNENKSESKSSKNKLDTNENKSREKSKSPKKPKEEIEIKSKNKNKPEISESSKSSTLGNGISNPDNVSCTLPTNTAMWVEKYKPMTIKQIIGQQGDASNVKKLINWLSKWYVNRKAKLPKPNPWAKNDDGGYYKAALLSGPPGVGKTTTVSLICKDLGFDMVEFNASDTRNKTLIKEQIGELLTTTSLSGFAKGLTGKQAVTKKHVLVMDEVDGMAGNEDRGGLQELIGLIKSASVPIICMCNDRNSQKMRSLVNYCYDLRFNRPRVDQIKSAMMSICFKEKIKIPPDVLSQLITSANQDVRQTLNLLSMWAVDPTLIDADRLRKDAQISKKDIKLGPWEAIRKVFSAEDHKTMSINDKSDLFFYDYSLSPLFVQENYLQVAPHCPKKEVLQRISNAADSISLGDLVDSRIRGSQAWSLLPLQAMYASVIPGHELSGHMTGQIQFPGWLGKNSRATKMRRLCQEIHAHTRLSTSGSKSSIYLDYAAHLRDAIVNPMIKDKGDGVDRSLEVLEAYHLLREDLDSLVELSVWPGQRNPTVLIDPKIKAAMTRTYNKKATALPYAPGAVKKGRGLDQEDTGEEEFEEEDPVDSDPENDALIKKKKVKDTEKASSSKSKTSKPTSKKKKET